jgi:tRNA A-37 threonylcarbamoyl transferase component Bud32
VQQTLIDNRYAPGHLLGSGGMAEVYLAHDEVLGRDVALKVLKHRYARDEEFVERFRREAQSAAALNHPNVVPVYDWGRSEDGTYYMAMEYIPGGTLKDRIAGEGPLDPGTAAGLGSRVARALAFAHEKGVIHRDIKSQNILLTEAGDAKVTDFGIARAATATTISRTGVVLGTAGYMSPEQAKGEPVGPRSDLYSLGVVLYEMLTGNLPYEAESPVAVALKHVNEPPRSPREANPDVPELLDALTVKLLAKNPEDRYASAAELAEDLERSDLPPFAAGTEKTEEVTAPLPPTAVQPPVGAPGSGRRRRSRLFPALAALLFGVVLLGVLAWALTQDRGAPEDTSGAEAAEPSTVRVPELYYASEAEGVLAGAGLKLGSWNEAPSDTAPAGVVVEQDPAAETEVEEGTAVDIVVSTGPQQAPAAQAAPASAAPVPAPPAYGKKAVKKADKERKEAIKKAKKKQKGKKK